VSPSRGEAVSPFRGEAGFDVHPCDGLPLSLVAANDASHLRSQRKDLRYR
jgi:hypothetical protein